MSGSDSGAPWAFWLYLVPGAAAVFLLVYRIVVSISTRLSGPASERPVAESPLITRAPIPFPGNRIPLPSGGLPLPGARVPLPGSGVPLPSADVPVVRIEDTLDPPSEASSSIRQNIRNRPAAPGGLRWPT